MPEQFTNWPLLKKRLEKATLPLTIQNIDGNHGFKSDHGHFAKAVITKEDYPCPIIRGRSYPNFYIIRIYRHENDKKPHQSWALDATYSGYISTFQGEVSSSLGSGGPFALEQESGIPINSLLYTTLAKAGFLDD